MESSFAHLLLLEFSVLGNERGEAVVDATLLQELLELLLDGDIKGVELAIRQHQGANSRITANSPWDRCRGRGASSPPQQ